MQPEVTVEYNILSSGSFYKGVFVLQIARLDFDGGGCLRGERLLVGRTSALTASPRSASTRTRLLPKKPVALVIKTRMVQSRGKSHKNSLPNQISLAVKFFYYQRCVLAAERK
jgi:hypothetical protein